MDYQEPLVVHSLIEEFDILTYYMCKLRSHLDIKRQRLALKLLFRHFHNNMIYLNILGSQVDNYLNSIKNTFVNV
jgi:hypothetical protein